MHKIEQDSFGNLMETSLQEFLRGESVLVSVATMPFFVQRFIVAEKRLRDGFPPLYWAVGEETRNSLEERVERFFSSAYPSARTIFFLPNQETVEEYQLLINDETHLAIWG